MENYMKLVGQTVGGIIGLLVFVVNQLWGFDLTGVQEPVAAVVTTFLGGLIGTWVSPKNVSAEDKAKDAELESLRATVGSS